MAKLPLRIWRRSLYIPSHPGRADVIEQSGEGDEVGGPERGASVSNDHERVRRVHIGPSRRNAAQLIMAIEEEDPILAPVVLAFDQLEILAEQRMEWMCHPDALLPNRPIGCNRRVGPSLASSGQFRLFATVSSPGRASWT